MILYSAFLFAPLANAAAARFSGFVFVLARADYVKFLKWSNRFLKKFGCLPSAFIKILHPAPGFGFILPCRDSRKPSGAS
jgi:hypothetical protein